MAEDIVELIKARVRIEEVIGKEFELSTHGRYAKVRGQGGLVVDRMRQSYFWVQQDEHGDVIEWVMKRNRLDFRAAIEQICRENGLPAPDWGKQDPAARAAARAREDALEVAQRVFERWFWASQAAQDYVRSRGWSLEREDDQIEVSTAGTAVLARLGYSGEGSNAEREEMRRELIGGGVDLDSPAAVAITGKKGGLVEWAQSHGIVLNDDWIANGYCPGMLGHKRLVYAHIHNARVVNLSGRSIEDKLHYNLPEALIGKRVVYTNHAYGNASPACVIVEGQADAISFAQWDVPGKALNGVHWDERLLDQLKHHKTLYYCLDLDAPGVISLFGMVEFLPPLSRLVIVRSIAGMEFEPREDARPHEIEQIHKANDALVALAKLFDWPLRPELCQWRDHAGEVVENKDANDLLRAMVGQDVPPDQQEVMVKTLMDKSPTVLEFVAAWAGMQEGAARDESMRLAASVIRRVEEIDRAQYDGRVSKLLGINQRELNKLVKAAESAKDKTLGSATPTYTWGGPVGEWLLEYLYEPESRTSRLAWRDPAGVIDSGEAVKIDGATYVAMPPNEAVMNEAIQLPSKLGGHHSIAELIYCCESYIKEVYILPSARMARLMSYWVLQSWLYDAFETTIYLRAIGGAGSGKSELMRRLGLISYRTIIASGAASPSSLFRMVERYRGTVFIDESDLENSDTTNDIVKFYNQGAMKNNPIWRTVEVTGIDGEKTWEERNFQTFCPKLIAMRKDFRDDAVGSRSLTFRLQPREMNELIAAKVPLTITEAIRNKARAIRNMLVQWRLETWQPYIEVDSSFYDLTISARLNQVAGPLLAIAKEDPAQQEEIRRNLREYYQETILNNSMTMVARVIEAMWKIWLYPDNRARLVKEEPDGDKLIKIGEITRIVNELIAEMNDEDDDDDGGKKGEKKVKPRRIGYILREDMQMEITERRRDGFWVKLNLPRLTGLSTRYGVKPDELGPTAGKASMKQPFLPQENVSSPLTQPLPAPSGSASRGEE